MSSNCLWFLLYICELGTDKIDDLCQSIRNVFILYYLYLVINDQTSLYLIKTSRTPQFYLRL